MALIMMPPKKKAEPKPAPAKPATAQTTVAVMEPEVIAPVIPKVQTTTELEAMVGEYLELWKKYDYFEVKAMVKRMEEIRKALVAHANDTMDNAKPAIFTCPQGEVEFSERGKVATVPAPLALVQDLLLKFGPEVTESVVDIGITALRKVLSDFELKKYLVDEPGTRTLKGVRPAK